jgi:hypothetical protein
MHKQADARRFARDIQTQGKSDLSTDPLDDLKYMRLTEAIMYLDDLDRNMLKKSGAYCTGYSGYDDGICICGLHNTNPDTDPDLEKPGTLVLSLSALAS